MGALTANWMNVLAYAGVEFVGMTVLVGPMVSSLGSIGAYLYRGLETHAKMAISQTNPLGAFKPFG